MTLERLAQMVQMGFIDMGNRLDRLEIRVGNLENRVSNLESRVGGIEGRLIRIESQMVTKAYLDDKLADLKGGLVDLIRKEDTRVTSLIGTLHHKDVLTKVETRKLLSLQPWPRTR